MRKDGSFAASKTILPIFFSGLIFLLIALKGYAQPANDNCAAASTVNISSGGFGIGVFTSSTFDLTSATVQPGETFAPAILVAGQSQKSVWYKFTLPTTRSVRVTLAQPGSLITAGDAGFAVYKTNNCLPAGAEISTKLTPIGVFGNSFHPCVETGEYLVQVSSKAAANGPVYITIETGQPTAIYDLPSQAYNFGVIPAHTWIPAYSFNVDCQTIDDANENCNTLGNYQDYTKSTWHVFTTPAYLDYLAYSIGGAFLKAGIKIYQGDVRSTPYASLPVVKACDSLPALKFFDCNEINPNTTYSIQLFFDKNFEGQVNFSFYAGGFAPTIAPEPILSAITPTTNNLGVLPASPAGITTGRNDFLACNSRIDLHPCSPSLPAGGLTLGGQRWNLSTFFMFTLSGTSNVSFNIANSNPAGSCGNGLLVRIYNQKVTNNCSDLSTSNIISEFIGSNNLSCLPPGDYTMQVMGLDSIWVRSGIYCIRNNLGTIFDMNITVKSVQTINQFSLSAPGKFDTINNVSGTMQPLVPGTTYTSKVDTFGCANTVMPTDNCSPLYTKAMYREFIVPDSGMVSIWNAPGTFQKIYRGDANALAIGQNTFNYPGVINGLTPYTICIGDLNPGFVACEGRKVCVEPGTYTAVTFGDNSYIGATNQLQAQFNAVNTIHGTPANAEDMGNVLSIIPPAGGSVTSSVDYYSCKDNAVPIDGVLPCTINGRTATKVIYRQFYLSNDAAITIESLSEGCGGGGLITIFRGKATDGLSSLTATQNRCLSNTGWSVCSPLTAGWYTIVSYGAGPSYSNPTRDLGDYRFNTYSNYTGYGNKVRISWSPSTCPLPKYNRPNKAAIDTLTNQPFLIKWGPRVGSTSAYPRTDTTYNLYTENFLCPDTPFAAHPVLPCSTDPGMIRVAYYVFQVTQESFLKINTLGPGEWTRASVYAGNVRATPNLLINTSPIQPCIDGTIGQLMLCNVQPGYYTLVVYANNNMSCRSVTPSIYIDRMGYSRFDHANNAYDFGLIPSDSVWHNGKTGDVNPLDPGRAPSNDFFYCTTGSRPDDPAYYCNNGNTYVPQLYTAGVNYPIFPANWYYGTFGNLPRVARQNLWYTFTVDKGGWVRIRVNNKTTGKTFQYPYNVMKSDVNGSVPFSTVVSLGAVDSTAAQGLTGIANNANGFTCIGGPEVAFFRETCSPVPERYYIVIQNDIEGVMLPNHQVEVEILFDSVNAIQPKFDHYYQASTIGTNLGPGTYNGEQDNISCATRDATDPSWPVVNCGDKTIWYKFSTTVSGYIKMRFYNSALGYFDAGVSRIQLFREIIPGDSTVNGLQYIGSSFVNYGGGVYYEQACISPGNYYIILPNCSIGAGYEYPQIILEENLGDFCARPVTATLNGAGTSVTSVLVNCHTIGTDYGEFNPTLTCPAGAITNQYKTSWFKINITGTDTLDVTTYLTESTNATSSQIKYRLMNGDCNAMQERSCVQDALTQDTYKCLAPGDYWVQVFTPVTVSGNSVTGTINLHLSGVKHVDTCAPINTCLSNANFQKQFDCTQSTEVRFINYSTFGTSVSYLWNFGYAGQTSTAVSPSFIYPSLQTAQKYYITLKVTNNSCGEFSIYTDSITIPARPVVNLGADTSLCKGGSVILNATSHPGSIYQWSTGAVTPTITAASAGLITYTVTVTYNGCIARDTIRVNIDPINPLKQNKYICGSNVVQLNSSRGLGESYSWSTGTNTPGINVFAAGIYWCDINLNGCITRDSFIVSTGVTTLGNDRQECFAGSPIVLNATTNGATGYTWQNGSTNPTFNASAAGLYWVDINFGNCILRDTVILSNLQPVFGNMGSVICQGQSFTAPSGKIFTSTGIYKDTLKTIQGCDSIINTINLVVQSLSIVSNTTSICSGQTFTLPWGTVVNTTGTYRDTLRYVNTGCDSVRRTVNLTVQSLTVQTINAGICSGQIYTLPWGTIVNAPGIYKDTLRYTTGCDSLYRTVNLSVATSQIQTLNPVICSGQTYTLPWGIVVNTPGVYKDTLRYLGGCDSLYRTINLTVQTTITQSTNPKICNGQSYNLPSGTVVSTTGIYRDTLRYAGTGCDSLIRVVNLIVQSSFTSIINSEICSGQTYTLPWGVVVATAGTYRDTLRYTVTNCDSVYRIVNLGVQTTTTQTTNPKICTGQTYTLPWGTVVSTAGTYRDTLKYTITNCDSVYRIVNLIIQTSTTQTTNPKICPGQTYTLPWGTVVSTAGTYRDTLKYAVTNCDSIYRIVNLTVQAATAQTTNAKFCAGQTYTLPWGTVVSTAGTYRDTLRYTITNCDSVYRIVNLTVQTATTQTTNAKFCAGQTYTLPWGTMVAIAGTYRDTLRYTVTNCDSVYRIVNLTVQTATTQTTNAKFCAGQTYTLPWGTVVATAGTYRDTLKYTVTNCDSVYRIVNLTVQTATTQTTNAKFCAGQTYTLPWGTVVATAGTYRDTLKYTVTNCDSVYRVVNLTVQTATSQTTNAKFCAGQTYTLPWGTIVSTAGIYKDTLRYTVTNCDSVYRIVNLSVQTTSAQTINAKICAGQTYTLPWGSLVSTSGIYRDTLRYTITNCDSVYRIVNLTVQLTNTQTSNPKICAGQTYTLPWGTVVSTAGTYRDTLKYTVTNCDSIYRIVTLTVQSPTTQTTNPKICAGQSYTLPWGTVVSTTGTYRDTLRYTITNCDSVYRIVNLIVQTTTTQSTNATICAGQTYTLPWGTTVATAGTYRDTLRYTVTNCDSVYRIVNLTVQTATTQSTNPKICAGQTYTLPWGAVVTSPGTYRDTLRYTVTNCDSVYRIVNLTVQTATTQTTNPKICTGQNYTLPWGATVTASGTYRDTLRYSVTNCDSVYRIVNLTVQSVITQPVIKAFICQGSAYTLPWGGTATTSGIYRDTIRYAATGCDSLRRTVDLTVQSASTVNVNATVCQGQAYQLPSGTLINSNGTYRDTLRYKITNCDSLYTIVNLTVTPARTASFNASICTGDTYILPWGALVASAGIYKDTLRTAIGCDSLIRTVTLTVNAKPTIRLSKSNDVNCVVGTAKLNATGGHRYLWSPAGSLSNANVSNPLAFPSITTTYRVRVTAANGCQATDSITVAVSTAQTPNAFPVPNAFSPNNDGLNDCFGVQHWGAVSNFTFEIFNRWGQRIFSTTNINDCWNGTYKNIKQDPGLFGYRITAVTNCGKITREGTVYLIQ